MAKGTLNTKLSPPIVLDPNLNIHQQFDYVYNNFFRNHFMNRDARPKLFDKFIFFKFDKMNDGKPERFWHIVSFEEDIEKYTVNPCANTTEAALCKNLKQDCIEKKAIPGNWELNGRTECLYRLARVHWISEIVELANKKDPGVWVTTGSRVNDKGKKTEIVKLWYREYDTDFVIIFHDSSSSGGSGSLRFITAYPLTLKAEKLKYKKNKSPVSAILNPGFSFHN